MLPPIRARRKPMSGNRANGLRWSAHNRRLRAAGLQANLIAFAPMSKAAFLIVAM